jgi:peptidoglycan biosynthesis protein MviN/MurJ (putative lipid II flippase)
LFAPFEHDDGGDGFASRLITTISLILLVLVTLGMIFAPALVRLYAPEFFTPGFETEQEIAVAFTRYCLPQIFFLGLFTMLGQVANARGSFGPLMWAPIANNLVGIVLFGGFLLAFTRCEHLKHYAAAGTNLGLGNHVKRCCSSFSSGASYQAFRNHNQTKAWP